MEEGDVGGVEAVRMGEDDGVVGVDIVDGTGEMIGAGERCWKLGCRWSC